MPETSTTRRAALGTLLSASALAIPATISHGGPGKTNRRRDVPLFATLLAEL
jgi:hypothetical protein